MKQNPPESIQHSYLRYLVFPHEKDMAHTVEDRDLSVVASERTISLPGNFKCAMASVFSLEIWCCQCPPFT